MCGFVLLLLGALRVEAQHAHYAVGFQDMNGNGVADAGEPLRFVGDSGAGKIFHLLARPIGQPCGGRYMLGDQPRTLFPNDVFSFVVLSDGQVEAEAPDHPLTGAYVWMEIVSVQGPAGAKFGFWEEGTSSGPAPTASFVTNQPTGNYRFVLSEGTDDSDQDPAGHIHGRSWTADKPGDYAIGFRLVDLSTSGPGGGSWHTPSPVYTFHFQAGPSFQPTVKKVSNTYMLTWPSQMGYWTTDAQQTGVSFVILRSTSLAPQSWAPIGTVVGTTANTATFTDTSPPNGQAFYRLSYQWSTP